jgi:PKD repeat protein
VQFAHTLARPAVPTAYRVRALFESEAGPPSNVAMFDPGLAPQIDDVAPQSGEEGEQVTLVATLSGGLPDNYSWSFGGGATPDTSSDVSPMVTLGTLGDYSASLTVSNAAGSDTFDFTLSVTDVSTVQIESVSPTTGETGGFVQFVPVITGPSDTWLWEFNGAAEVPQSVEQTPTVTLQAEGQYNIMLC